LARGDTATQEANQLSSGSYKYVCHGTRAVFADIEAAKAEIKEQWEQREGITVDRIEIKDVPAHALETGWIWQDGLQNIGEEHTDVEIYFTVASPFPWLVLLAVIGLALVVLAAYSPTFQKLAEATYQVAKEAPWALGLLALAFVLMVAVPAVPAIAKAVKKPKEEKKEGIAV